MKITAHVLVAALVVPVFLLLYSHAQDTPLHPAVHWVSVRMSPVSHEECVDPHPLLLMVKENGLILLGGAKLKEQKLRPVISKVLKERSDKRIFVKASAKLRYGDVIRIISELNPNSDSVVILLTPSMESDPCAPPIPINWLR